MPTCSQIGITDHVVKAFNKPSFELYRARPLPWQTLSVDFLGLVLIRTRWNSSLWLINHTIAYIYNLFHFLRKRQTEKYLHYGVCTRYLSRSDIKDFKEQTMESNRAFKSACLYMKCGAFKDICFAVGVIHAHLVRPSLNDMYELNQVPTAHTPLELFFVRPFG